MSRELERDLGAPGVRFEEVDGKVMYLNVLDASNTIGPRAATAADKANNPFEWDQFKAGVAPTHPAEIKPGKRQKGG